MRVATCNAARQLLLSCSCCLAHCCCLHVACCGCSPSAVAADAASAAPPFLIALRHLPVSVEALQCNTGRITTPESQPWLGRTTHCLGRANKRVQHACLNTPQLKVQLSASCVVAALLLLFAPLLSATRWAGGLTSWPHQHCISHSGAMRHVVK